MQYEGYFEESITMNKDAMTKGKSKNLMFSIISYCFLGTAIFLLFMFFLSGFASWILLIPIAIFLIGFVFFRMRKDRYVFECDYILVESSLRIAKVLNGKFRKPLAVVDCKDITNAGKIDSDNYKRFDTMKDVKKIVATPNVGYNDENIYFLFYTGQNGRRLLVFEPSSLLLLSVSKSAKKNIFNA